MSQTSTLEKEVKVRGDLKCYHCGYVSGIVEGKADIPMQQRQFIPSENYPLKTDSTPFPERCIRCGGPLYLDEIEIVRERVWNCVVDPYETRPGRRPGSKCKKSKRSTSEAKCA